MRTRVRVLGLFRLASRLLTAPALALNRDLQNGEQFPVTLRFADAQGGAIAATATVVVRCFTVRPAEPDPRRP